MPENDHLPDETGKNSSVHSSNDTQKNPVTLSNSGNHYIL